MLYPGAKVEAQVRIMQSHVECICRHLHAMLDSSIDLKLVWAFQYIAYDNGFLHCGGNLDL